MESFLPAASSSWHCCSWDCRDAKVRKNLGTLGSGPDRTHLEISYSKCRHTQTRDETQASGAPAGPPSPQLLGLPQLTPTSFPPVFS